jgi:hypothetical protein
MLGSTRGLIPRGRSSDPTPATSRHGESPRARQRKAIDVPDEEGRSDVYEPDVGLEELDPLPNVV